MKVKDIFNWWDNFDNRTVLLKSRSKEFLVEIKRQNLPHLLGLQYMFTPHTPASKIMNEVNKNNYDTSDVEKAVRNNRKINYKMGANFPQNIRNRTETFKTFMENLENARIVEMTNPKSKIHSDYLAIADKNGEINHLGILDTGEVSYFSEFDVNVLETYFSRKNNDYFKNTTIDEPIEHILFYEEEKDMWREGSFNLEKDEALHREFIKEIFYARKTEIEKLTEQIKEASHTDTFLINKEQENVDWVYFNPDSNDGGQYVVNSFDFDLIKEAARDWEIPDEFFDFIGNCSKQTLVDIEDTEFIATHMMFLHTNDEYTITGNTSNLEEMKNNLIKETIGGEDMEKTQRKVYLNVYKTFAKLDVERMDGTGTYNEVTLPKGVIVDGKDLSGGKIYPKDEYIYPNKWKKEHLMTVQYLDKQNVRVNLKDGDFEIVTGEKLTSAVEAANKAYLEENREKAAEAEAKNKEPKKEAYKTKEQEDEIEI